MYKSPQIFHDKEENKQVHYVLYPNDLFAAINNMFSRNEAIILLTWLGCKGDGSFSPNISYMLKMTGIKAPENYYRIKRDLIESQYVIEEDGCIHIEANRIIDDWKKGITKTQRKNERDASRTKRAKPKSTDEL